MIIWQVPTAVVKNIETIIVTRFLVGFSGAAFLSVSGGSITDMWIKEQVIWPMVIYTLGPFLGPTIGPLVGGFINENVSWRWIFHVVIIWAGVEVSDFKDLTDFSLLLSLLSLRHTHLLFLRRKLNTYEIMKIIRITSRRWKLKINL